jgi:hypothetical protein
VVADVCPAGSPRKIIVTTPTGQDVVGSLASVETVMSPTTLQAAVAGSGADEIILSPGLDAIVSSLGDDDVLAVSALETVFLGSTDDRGGLAEAARRSSPTHPGPIRLTAMREDPRQPSDES